MIAMPYVIDGEPHMTIAETVAFMGCTDGWVRALLREKKLKGRLMGKRLWVVSVSSATEQREALTTRATGKKHLAKRPAAKRKKPKKAARRKK